MERAFNILTSTIVQSAMFHRINVAERFTLYIKYTVKFCPHLFVHIHYYSLSCGGFFDLLLINIYMLNMYMLEEIDYSKLIGIASRSRVRLREID